MAGTSSALSTLDLAPVQLRAEHIPISSFIRPPNGRGRRSSLGRGLAFRRTSSRRTTAVTLTVPQFRQVVELAAGWPLFGLEQAVITDDHATNASTPESSMSPDIKSPIAQAAQAASGDDPAGSRGFSSPVAPRIGGSSKDVPQLAAKSLLGIARDSELEDGLLTARGDGIGNVTRKSVRIPSVLSFNDLIGQCGVIQLDSSTGPELVLARVQRTSWNGEKFSLIGWTTIDMPMEPTQFGAGNGFGQRPQSPAGSIPGSVDVVSAGSHEEEAAVQWQGEDHDEDQYQRKWGRNGNGFFNNASASDRGKAQDARSSSASDSVMSVNEVGAILPSSSNEVMIVNQDDDGDEDTTEKKSESPGKNDHLSRSSLRHTSDSMPLVEPSNSSTNLKGRQGSSSSYITENPSSGSNSQIPFRGGRMSSRDGSARSRDSRTYPKQVSLAAGTLASDPRRRGGRQVHAPTGGAASVASSHYKPR